MPTSPNPGPSNRGTTSRKHQTRMLDEGQSLFLKCDGQKYLNNNVRYTYEWKYPVNLNNSIFKFYLLRISYFYCIHFCLKNSNIL